jgi:hypothetical protein
MLPVKQPARVKAAVISFFSRKARTTTTTRQWPPAAAAARARDCYSYREESEVVLGYAAVA